jgi:Fic family protein
MGSSWLLNDIAEAKGKQELFTRQSPQALKALREMALIQSAESSNRIEGVTVEPGRLRPLVLGTAKPRDRSEQEVMGYRLALHEIHSRHNKFPVSPRTLQHLHALCQSASGDAGQFKQKDNDILQLVTDGPPILRFRCLPAAETPAALDELCQLYHHALDQDHIPPLVAMAALVLDFLCIHPFRDGNGRVSRLLTLLALYHHGYEVGRYVSLERLVEETKEGYHEALHASSQGWHEGGHDLLPWLNFQWAILRRAYTEFERRVGEVDAPRGAKTALVLHAIRAQTAEFRISDIERACPGVGREWIRTLLSELKETQEVQCQGKGPGARWTYLGNKGIKS